MSKTREDLLAQIKYKPSFDGTLFGQNKEVQQFQQLNFLKEITLNEPVFIAPISPCNSLQCAKLEYLAEQLGIQIEFVASGRYMYIRVRDLASKNILQQYGFVEDFEGFILGETTVLPSQKSLKEYQNRVARERYIQEKLIGKISPEHPYTNRHTEISLLRELKFVEVQEQDGTTKLVACIADTGIFKFHYSKDNHFLRQELRFLAKTMGIDIQFEKDNCGTLFITVLEKESINLLRTNGFVDSSSNSYLPVRGSLVPETTTLSPSLQENLRIMNAMSSLCPVNEPIDTHRFGIAQREWDNLDQAYFPVMGVKHLSSLYSDPVDIDLNQVEPDSPIGKLWNRFRGMNSDIKDPKGLLSAPIPVEAVVVSMPGLRTGNQLASDGKALAVSNFSLYCSKKQDTRIVIAAAVDPKSHRTFAKTWRADEPDTPSVVFIEETQEKELTTEEAIANQATHDAIYSIIAVLNESTNELKEIQVIKMLPSVINSEKWEKQEQKVTTEAKAEQQVSLMKRQLTALHTSLVETQTQTVARAAAEQVVAKQRAEAEKVAAQLQAEADARALALAEQKREAIAHKVKTAIFEDAVREEARKQAAQEQKDEDAAAALLEAKQQAASKAQTSKTLPYLSPEELQNLSANLQSEGSPSIFDLRLLTGFATVLGIAAVVLAFTVLNAATLGTAGIVVAAAGAGVAVISTYFFAKSLASESTPTAKYEPLPT